MTDQDTIRELILRWADAVHTGDLETVLADRDQDIVQFDVAPPCDGLRGIDAYRDSWPDFFEWQRQGAIFEITELDVTVGDEVAFAYALARCGKPEDFEKNPDNRLRMTFGLRKRDDRWVVTHEHGSFPLAG